MPGTIHVSVLDFEGQQASSEMFIKISMGKREYQSKDKGEFSFPLTSLHHNLIVTLQDEDGTEVSHTGVQTRMVIEKGVWDEIFPLDGGGHVHLRLQFLLSEEDHERIRTTRQSALRKKHTELIQRDVKTSKKAIASGANAEPSFPHSNEVSGPSSAYAKKSILHREDVANLFKKGKRSPEDREATYPMPKKESLYDANLYEKTTSTTRAPQQREVLPVSSAGAETRTAAAAAAASKVPLETERHEDHDRDHRIPLEETASNVRNTISVFESRLNQDKRPQMRLPPIPVASQSTKTKAEVHLNSSYSDEVKVSKYGLAKPRSGKAGDVANIWKGNQIGFVGEFSGATATENAMQLQESGAAFVETKERDEELNGTKVRPKGEASNEEQMVSEDVVKASTGRRASVSGHASNEQPGTRPFSDFFSSKRYSSSDFKSEKGNSPEGSKEMTNSEASADKRYSLETSGTWIFPDEGIRSCITTATTADKRIMDLKGGFLDESESKSEMASSAKEDLRKIVHCGAPCKAKQAEKTAPKLRKSTVEDQNDDQTSKGLLGQGVEWDGSFVDIDRATKSMQGITNLHS